MNPETKNCQNCKKDFTIESEDFAFYEKLKSRHRRGVRGAVSYVGLLCVTREVYINGNVLYAGKTK